MAINFDYGKAMSDANKLDGFAEELESLAKNRIDAVINSLNASWKGDSATLMINKCLAEKETVLNHASKLRKNANSLRSVAATIKKAEEEAIRRQKEMAKASNNTVAHAPSVEQENKKIDKNDVQDFFDDVADFLEDLGKKFKF